MLVTSIFNFSPKCFLKPSVFRTIKTQDCVVKGKMGSSVYNRGENIVGNVYQHLLQPFPKQALVFTCLQCKSFENTAGKGEIARNEQYLLFPQCFLPIWRTFCHFHQIKNCRLQTLSVWNSLKFVVCERVNNEVL